MINPHVITRYLQGLALRKWVNGQSQVASTLREVASLQDFHVERGSKLREKFPEYKMVVVHSGCHVSVSASLEVKCGFGGHGSEQGQRQGYLCQKGRCSGCLDVDEKVLLLPVDLQAQGLERDVTGSKAAACQRDMINLAKT